MILLYQKKSVAFGKQVIRDENRMSLADIPATF